MPFHSVVEVCMLPLEVGRCAQNQTAWHYNSITGLCSSFVYGGCRGNANRFGSQVNCESACSTSNTNVGSYFSEFLAAGVGVSKCIYCCLCIIQFNSVFFDVLFIFTIIRSIVSSSFSVQI